MMGGMTTPLYTTIQSAAAKAKRLKSRYEERESHSLADLMAADRYLANQQALTEANRFGLVLNQLKPVGSI